MYGGTDDVSPSLFNVFISGAKPKNLYSALNQDGLDKKGISHDGDSTVQDPVAISPWDAFVQTQNFIFTKEQKKIDKRETRASIIRERTRRKNARDLTDAMQKAYIDSVTKAKHQDDLSIVGVGGHGAKIKTSGSSSSFSESKIKTSGSSRIKTSSFCWRSSILSKTNSSGRL